VGVKLPMNIKSLTSTCLLVVVLTLFSSVSAKRSAPEAVPDIIHDGIRYTVVHWGAKNGTGQNGGYIEAWNEASGEKIWQLVIYAVEYDKHIEKDVQDVFIKTMAIDADGKNLVIVNELGEVYKIVLSSREVHRVELGIEPAGASDRDTLSHVL